MNDDPIQVAVVGASGYTGQELLRLLAMHPRVELVSVTSRQEAGRSLTDVYPRLAGAPGVEGLTFTRPDAEDVAEAGAVVAFLALPHGVASDYAGELLERGVRVIDLSADFRLRSAAVYEEFYGTHPAPDLLEKAVYGLPEFYAEEIASAELVASPGCYPTSILVPLAPLLREGVIESSGIAVASLSGASGAGRKADTSLLFAEVNESLRAYGAPKHRHLGEIEQELSLAADRDVKLTFVPHLMPVTAGIATTVFCEPTDAPDPVSVRVAAAYGKHYVNRPFVRVLGEGKFAETRHVVGTNFIDVGWVVDERANRLVLSSAEDNLGKGAASQAVQSFNLMNGLPEDRGLLHF